MILLSLAVWGAIWGVVGMFLAVPIMVTINAALAQFETTKPLAMFFSSNGDIKD
jgi:predicted PurR-regulated permease PerM